MKKKEPKPYARPEKLHSLSFKCDFAIKQLIQQAAMLQKKTISKYLENIVTHYPILRAEYNKLKHEFSIYKQDSEDQVKDLQRQITLQKKQSSPLPPKLQPFTAEDFRKEYENIGIAKYNSATPTPPPPPPPLKKEKGVYEKIIQMYYEWKIKSQPKSNAEMEKEALVKKITGKLDYIEFQLKEVIAINFNLKKELDLANSIIKNSDCTPKEKEKEKEKYDYSLNLTYWYRFAVLDANGTYYFSSSRIAKEFSGKSLGRKYIGSLYLSQKQKNTQ